MERCASHAEHDTPGSIAAKAASAILRLMDIKIRCTLPVGHAGYHLGSDDSTWPNTASTVTAAPVGLWDNEHSEGEASIYQGVTP